jgi:hypothetical protein
MIGLSSSLVTSALTTITPITPPYGQALAGATFSIGGHTLVLRNLVISTNPMLAIRKSVAGTGGFAAPCIMGFECTALARVELDAATHDFETSWTAVTSTALAPFPNTALALSLALPVGGMGTIAGARTLTVTGSFLLDGMPQRVDDGDGVLCLDVPLILNPTAILDTPDTTNSLKLLWSA